MNFNENDLWRDKAELLNLKPSQKPSAKVLLKLKFDTKDQVLFFFFIIFHCQCFSWNRCSNRISYSAQVVKAPKNHFAVYFLTARNKKPLSAILDFAGSKCVPPALLGWYNFQITSIKGGFYTKMTLHHSMPFPASFFMIL